MGGCPWPTGSLLTGSSPHEPRRFVVRWYRGVVSGAFGLFAVLLVSILLKSEAPSRSLWIVVPICFLGFLFVRGLRIAAIEFRAEDVLIRSFRGTKTIPVDQIERVDVVRGSSAALLPWRVPRFELRDGSAVIADEIRSMRSPSVVDDVVAEAIRRL